MAIGLILSVISVALGYGCMSDTSYQSYVDQKQRGEQAFIKDMQFCRQSANLNLKPSEGSEGAGERLQRKRSLFLVCMKDHYWVLKQ